MPRQITSEDGTLLNVAEWGSPANQSVVLIHGWSQGLLCWKKQFASSLAEGAHIVAVDLRGHGSSAAPQDAESYTEQNWAADINAIIQELKLTRPILVAWSYAGYIVGDYLRRFGDRELGGVVFVGCAPKANMSVVGRFIGEAFATSAPAAIDDDLHVSIPAMRSFVRACYHSQPSQDEYEEMLALNMVPTANVRAHLAGRDTDSSDVLPKLTVPTLVLHGRHDQLALPAAGEELSRLCPGAEITWFDQSGHVPFLEEPEKFNIALASFIDRIADVTPVYV
jgi:non-heme chloroperoxidase